MMESDENAGGAADEGGAEPERDPHHALNNPVGDPDMTEYPDPYEKRSDPRDPGLVDTPASPAERADETAATGGDAPPSTSEPQPPRNYDDLKPVKGDRED